MDAEGNVREGVSYCWWADSGKLMTAAGVYDEDGNEITPPTFATGVVALMKLHTSFWDADKIADQSYDENGTPQLEQWQRSAALQYIKNNGTLGSMAGGEINYYELGGIRLFRPADVEAFLAARGLPGHTWVNGNSY
jgi:hypothetical protein